MKLQGVAKAHEEAQQDYDLAVANNQTAFLGEETKADIFKVNTLSSKLSYTFLFRST